MTAASVLLTTERLELVRFTAADVDHLVALDGDPEVMRFLTGGTPTPRTFIEQRVLPRFLHHDPARPEFGYWAGPRARERRVPGLVRVPARRRARPGGRRARLSPAASGVGQGVRDRGRASARRARFLAPRRRARVRDDVRGQRGLSARARQGRLPADPPVPDAPRAARRHVRRAPRRACGTATTWSSSWSAPSGAREGSYTPVIASEGRDAVWRSLPFDGCVARRGTGTFRCARRRSGTSTRAS